MKSFDKWVDELRDQVNKQPDLPEGIVLGNSDGEYLYQCRSCGDWNPIDWDLDEDSYEGHYCGKGPQCCPMPGVPAGSPGTVAPPPAPPSAPKQKAKATPQPADPFYSQHEVCAGCNTRIPLSHVFRHPKTGDVFCGSQVCYDALAYGYSQKSPNAQPAIDSSHFKCFGCNGRYHIRDAKTHPRTGEAFCGRTSCGIKIQQNRP